jgi:hypothetical protein
MNASLARGMLAVGLIASIGVAEPSDAKTAKGPTPYAPVIAELRTAKHELDRANHDYHGHRAKADHEIARAIHLLEHGTHHPKTGAAKGKAKHHNEAQPLSDAQLRHAEQIVRVAISQLSTVKNDPRAHQANVVLHDAVREIEHALAVHHKLVAKK